ncbi:MAG: asparagine synthase (glutamine-hydrolyzing) [Chloroflexota bacterium]|nr:asparagine synthase (glutamine-hydrolyzing) [Chloroflexota bacterium]
MCGIAGIVSEDPTIRDERILEAMLRTIEHRGPDDEGIAAAAPAVLGARRLSIIDVVAGHQPMHGEDGAVTAVQNGEIYNFATLREELAAAGHRFRTGSDTEVLPHAWEEWGPGLVERLHGMFAIAVWDARARTLLLARDRFGKKPLMYAEVRDALLFASEIQALLAHPAVGREIDDEAIRRYLELGYVPSPRTGLAAVRKLPPAHLLLWRPGSAPDLRRYWTLRYAPKLRISDEEALSEVRRLVERAVERRLISDVPLGAFLSGGLDSSTVVAYMARHSSRPVRTFSVAFREGHYDESRYARIAARAFGTDHHELVVDAADTDALPMLVRHVGEPFADSSIVPTYQIARATRPYVTVALTGDGGDELFAGYDRYRAAALAERIPRPVAAGLAALSRALPGRDGVPRVIPRAKRFLAALSSEGEARRAAWTGYFTGRYAGLLLAPGRAAAAGGALERAAELTGAVDVSERYMAADILGYLPDDLLTKMDIATMAASLEARAPLLDHELHGFVARLPARSKLSVGASKILLRRAMRGVVPDEILDRSRKMGFTAPVAIWLRGPLRDLVADLVLSPSAATRLYVSPDGARRMFDDHVRRGADRTIQLWGLLMLELWFREVVAAPVPHRRAAKLSA